MSINCDGCKDCDGDGKVPCGVCQGTGIGQHGDPHTSRCAACKGRGWKWCPKKLDADEAMAEDYGCRPRKRRRSRAR